MSKRLPIIHPNAYLRPDSRLPDIRDEWDNLPDAEPEGIVSRGARLVRGEES